MPTPKQAAFLVFGLPTACVRPLEREREREIVQVLASHQSQDANAPTVAFRIQWLMWRWSGFDTTSAHTRVCCLRPVTFCCVLDLLLLDLLCWQYEHVSSAIKWHSYCRTHLQKRKAHSVARQLVCIACKTFTNPPSRQQASATSWAVHNQRIYGPRYASCSFFLTVLLAVALPFHA